MSGGFHTIVLKADKAAWAWGQNYLGCLGDNTSDIRSSPVLVVGNHQFISISSSFAHGVGLKENGEVWTWGFNDNGQLGHNTIANVSSPVLVIGNHTFIQIVTGSRGVSARKSNGEVWCWGDGGQGQLGDNTRTDKSSPVLVVGNHSFSSLEDLSADNITYLKANGEAWVCGSGFYGSLGDGTATRKSSPVAVIGNHSFIQTSTCTAAVFGLKSNGEIWSWGRNTNGQLGDNTRTNRSSPVLVVGNHSFIQVKAGNLFTVALKANGEAWCWGANNDSQLGDNTIVSKSSPVLVVGNHSFVEILARDKHTHARKANGEIWGWGDNTSGMLADYTTTDKSSPVLVVGNHNFFTLSETKDVEDIVVEDAIVGSVCFGHETGVTEDNIKSFFLESDAGYLIPLSIFNANEGDDEVLDIYQGNIVEFSIIYFGIRDCEILINKYKTGMGKYTIRYKTGETKISCEADSWKVYFEPFSCLGWMKMRIYT